MAATASRDPRSRMKKRGSSTILQQVNQSMQEVKDLLMFPCKGLSWRRT